MKIFARAELVPPALSQDERALLLEGAWPTGAASPSRWSLDEAIDARYGWIDREASRIAEQSAATTAGQLNRFAYLNALPLRYELVKWIRVLAFFEQCQRPIRRETVEVHLERDRDEPYAALVRELCRSHRLARIERWHGPATVRSIAFPPNRLWRQTLARMFASRAKPLNFQDPRRPRVVLCGNPRVLDPVCAELLRGDALVWWLYDRFAVHSFLRWRLLGVRQLVCQSSLGRAVDFSSLTFDQRIACRGVDLAPAIESWTNRLAATHGSRQSRLIDEITRHFAVIRPTAIVCDEDATPLPRAAVECSHPYDARSYVVQHGAPCVRFGFAPPAADRFLAWGDSSRRQLARWGVASDRIVVTGTPRRPATWRRSGPGHADRARSKRRPILLLATVPPRDDRPDAVEYHLTRATHRAMLEAAFACVARLRDARLTVKLHPRARHDGDFQAIMAAHPRLDVRVIRHGNLARLVRRASCVLSCASSAGVEAAAWGAPVIQLLPAGSIDLLPASEWGFVGMARTEHELDSLLAAVFNDTASLRNVAAARETTSQVFAAWGHEAARRVAEAVLAPAPLEVAEPVEPRSYEPRSFAEPALARRG